MDLKEILNRRSDLSTFLVHLTREYDEQTPRENLESILADGRIRARNIYGMLANREGQLTQAARRRQRVVCFTETPLEYTHLMVQEIQNRQFHFGPYGIAITKLIGRRRGANPVWYLDMTPGHHWLIHNVNALGAEFIEDDCVDANLAALFPFMEQMGTWPNGQKEFWWEREWRFRGHFPVDEVPFICLCPEEEIDDFVEILDDNDYRAKCIDPRWSLEKIIARLSGFEDGDIDIPE